MQKASRCEPQSLSLSIDLQARDAFFASYVATKCWDFLKPYYQPTDSPEHLTKAIEAVSLAYLWHQVYSDAALATARERYILALRMTNKILKSPKEQTKNTTLMASLLLDLFEKITDTETRNNSWTSHVNGALALVRLRGLDQFQDDSDFNMLVRLYRHYIVGCVASDSPVPDNLNAIEAYIGKRLSVKDPMLRLSNLMVQYANLRSKVRKDILSNDECIELSMELDGQIQALDRELPVYWQYSTISLEQKSERAFDLHFHSYPNPRRCQARNVCRIMRIILNASLIQPVSVPPTSHRDLALTGFALDNIETLAGEICACVPQYMDCDGAARHRLPASKKSDFGVDHILPRGHSHTPNHQLDCYTLIFPLYVAARSKAVPDMKPWVIKNLHYMSTHFHVRNAELVARILEQETDVDPWEIYAMLGSYAFAC